MRALVLVAGALLFFARRKTQGGQLHAMAIADPKEAAEVGLKV
jgi:hypothetical protein